MENQIDLGRLRKSEWIGGIIYWPIFLFGAPLLAALAVSAIWPTADAALWLSRTNFIYCLINAAALVLIFFRYLKAQLLRLQERGWRLFADLGIGYAAYYGLSIAAGYVISLLMQLFSTPYLNANQDAVEESLRVLPVLVILESLLLAPTAEELLTRGLIFGTLRRRSRILAYALSMLAFSLAHCVSNLPYQPFAVTLIDVVTYLPAGFVLAWVYERSGTIWTSVFLHAVINGVALLLQAAIR